MKKITYSTVIVAATLIAAVSSCKSKREPGSIYMPDMTYSRAIETYSPLDSLKYTADTAQIGEKIYYDRKPVEGTIHRGELFPYTLPNDSAGYAQSAMVKNPLPPLSAADSAETARLFNINCAICHGANGQATGPLANSGKVGGIANFTLPKYIDMADGTMFHSITYGIRNMGSYASQLDRKQRWQLIHYIRALQPKNAAVPAKDSAGTVKN